MSIRQSLVVRMRQSTAGLLAVFLAGCASASRDEETYHEQVVTPESTALTDLSRTSICAARHEDKLHANNASLASLLGAPHLDRHVLITTVLENNPSIAAAHEAWRAALARYPQQTAWDDPLVTYRSYPLSIGRVGVGYGQEIEISQRIPIGGKLDLAGAIALAEADAVNSDYQAVRIRLAMMASQIYDEYDVAVRSLVITASHLQVLEDLRSSAQAHVASGTGSVQDPLQAEAEIAELHEEQIAQAADRDVAMTQLNGLLHRLPIDGPLPLPIPDDAVTGPGDDSTALQEIAIRERPELRAIDAKSRQSESALSLAQQQYRPDIALSGSYGSLWDQRDYRYGLGITVALPVHTDRVQGGIDEAYARLAQARLEREHMEHDIRVEVHEAHRRVVAADATDAIVRDHLLPAIRSRVEAARSAYGAGRGSFADLMTALRALRAAEVRQEQVRAEVSRRRATLFQTLGCIPTFPVIGATP